MCTPVASAHSAQREASAHGSRTERRRTHRARHPRVAMDVTACPSDFAAVLARSTGLCHHRGAYGSPDECIQPTARRGGQGEAPGRVPDRGRGGGRRGGLRQPGPHRAALRGRGARHRPVGRAASGGQARLRPPAAALGGGAHLRLDEPVPPPGQRLRVAAGDGRGAAFRRLRLPHASSSDRIARPKSIIRSNEIRGSSSDGVAAQRGAGGGQAGARERRGRKVFVGKDASYDEGF